MARLLFGFLFFLSGAASLTYEIVWQRALFSMVGVNSEATTLVVSVFMLGLGLGSLLGGYLSERNVSLPLVLGMAEALTGVYGCVSLYGLRRIDGLTAGTVPWASSGLAPVFILPPVLIMGAILPLAAAYLVRISHRVGDSVGWFYFINTMGAAAGCFFAGFAGLRVLGLSGSVWAAVAANAVVACCMFAVHVKLGPGSSRATAVGAEPEARTELSLRLAIGVSALVGFTSIAYELLWMRAYHVFSGGDPRAFPYVLGSLLTGIALGSLTITRFVIGFRRRVDARRYLLISGALIAAGNLAGYFCAPLLARVAPFTPAWVTLPLIAVAGAALGSMFPLLCDAAVPPDAKAGRSIGKLYVGNVAGCVAAGVGVGYVALDLWSIREVHAGLLVGGIVSAMAVFAGGGQAGRLRWILSTGIVTVVLAAASGPLFSQFYERLQRKSSFDPAEHYETIVETRAGVVTVDDEGAVFGDGAYDGYIDTDVHNSDTVIRPLSLSLLHPDPRQVLIIGVAGGAWAQVVSEHPSLAKLTAIEINPGYLQVIRAYSEVAPLLRNPKVQVVVADARHWLSTHAERFDVIFMDTTYHWRAHASNLLSQEFLRIARAHLRPGGLLYYNTTHSPMAQRTGATEFSSALRFGPFLAVSDAPIKLDVDRWKEILLRYRIDGHPVFDLHDAEHVQRLNHLLSLPLAMDTAEYDHWGFESRQHILTRTQGEVLITDDNMASEWVRRP